MKPRRGHIWYEDRRVGSLRSDARGAIHFAYDNEWLSNGFPISLRLPLSNGADEVNGHGFFQGLLPEGASRQRICRLLRIDPNDDASLLLAIGEDCAGALSILAGDEEPDDQAAAPEPISDRTIRDIVRTGGESISAIGGTRRFSLAGAQEKLPVIHCDGEFLKPTRAHPSTHLLKFETHPFVCFSEYTTLSLARRLGLAVIDCTFHTIKSQGREIPFLKIPRYDRSLEADGRVIRLHQEDLVQALGYETSFKYQNDGGPGLADVVELLRRETENPPAQIRTLLDWQLFNFLTSNYDGHGKNLALLYSTSSSLPELAPAYDLVSIEFLNRVGNTNYSREMAFAIGGQYVPERIDKAAWQQFATDLGVRAELVFRRLRQMAEALPDLADEARQAFIDEFGDKPVYERYSRIINKRCRWVLQVIG